MFEFDSVLWISSNRFSISALVLEKKHAMIIFK